ncbi:MAG: PAS domain S-box protein [Deltaproteobacteria bacterium]|nr:PAS domain S-box protein [Deltaproteobacteria bacterium]
MNANKDNDKDKDKDKDKDEKASLEGLQRILKDLEKSQHEQQQVLDTISDVLFRTDPEGRFIFVSSAIERMSSYTKEEMIGRCIFDFIHPEDLERVAEGVAQTYHGRIEPLEFRVNDKDGSERFVRTWGRVMEENGQVVGIGGIMSDLTELRKVEADKADLEEQLQQSQKMEALGRLAGGVAHDFNNLLFVMLNYASLIEERAGDGTVDAKQAGAIRQAAERAGELTRQLLTFSRTKVVKLRRFDLNEVLVEMESMLRRIVGEDVQLSTRLAKDLPCIACDRSHLDQVLINLAANARDAMAGGGSLTLETRLIELGPDLVPSELQLEPGPYVCLTVRDTGCGMSKDVLGRAFEPFFTTKKDSSGTGLGLSTVYSAIRQSGGLVRMDSSPGRGTLVEVYLPMANGDASALDKSDRQEATERHALPSDGRRVALLVEDEPQVRELSRTMLENEGFTVLDAGHPEEALRLARLHRGPLSLLLTDVVMPDMNGRQLAEQLCRERPEVKVLYMSGYTDNVIAQHGMLDVDVMLLEKPFTAKELHTKLCDLFLPCDDEEEKEDD